MDPQPPSKNYHERIQTESERRAFTISPPTIPRMSDVESLRVFSGAATWKGVCASTRRSSPLQIVNCDRSNPSMSSIPDSTNSHIHGRQRRSSPFIPPNSLSIDCYFTPLRSTELESPPSSSHHTLNLLSSTSQSPSTIRPNSAFSVETLSSIDELGPSAEQSTTVDTVSSDRRKSKARRGASTSSSKRKSRKSSPSRTFIDNDLGTQTDEKTPPQQNLRGDPFRSAKVKTELCRYYRAGKECPFGEKCNYAHGQHELKFTRIMDLEQAGLIDIQIFRTRPCCTWVMCGTCPHDSRCLGLHSPKISYEGDIQLIPHAETSVNKVESGANVDKLYHSRLASTYSCSPLYGYVPPKKWKIDSNSITSEWNHFCATICNISSSRPQKPTNASNAILSEAQVLEIVLSLRKERLGQAYLYDPTHIFCGELCMILQTKRYQLIPSSTGPGQKVIEILPQPESPSIDQMFDVEAHEIAFGPVGDPSVRSLSIWFNIPRSVLVPCTVQQAKHQKRSRHRLRKTNTENILNSRILSINNFQTEESRKIDRVTKMPPFYHHQPHDDSTFDFITDILNHRLDLLKSEKENENNIHRQFRRRQQSEALKNKFVSFCRHWTTWSWPVRLLEEAITDETIAPQVEAEYYFTVDDEYGFQTEAFFGQDDTELMDLRSSDESKLLPLFIWKSFLFNLQLICRKKNHDRRVKSPRDVPHRYLNRLKVFQILSRGNTMSRSRRLPHLNGGTRSRSEKGTNIESLLREWEKIMGYHKEHLASSRNSQPLKEFEKRDAHAEDCGSLLENGALMMTRMLYL